MDQLYEQLIKLAAPHALAIITKHVVPAAASFTKGKFTRSKNKKQVEACLKSYLQRLYAESSIIKTIAFAGQPKQLTDLYIPLTLVDLSDQELEVNESTDIFETSSSVVILDAAGMGKSTLVKRLVLNNIVSGKYFPILYPLRAFYLDTTLERELFKIMGLPETTPTDALSKLNPAIYLDGLDEAPDDLASTIVKQISDFQTKFPSIRVLVSSRKQSEVSDLLKYKCFKIKELSTDQANKLIKKYDNDGEISKSLIKEIKKLKFEGIKEYLSNPLYVSLLYCAFRHKPSLPQKMCLFYEQVYHALFDQHDLTKAANYKHSLRTNLDSHEFSQILRRLAFVGLVDGFRIEYSKLDFENKISKVAEDIEHLTFKVKDFVRDATIAVPLFVDEGTTVRWAHKSLLEFFAAMFICYDTGPMGEQIMLRLAEHERASNYRHILEMCADIHYKLFRDSVGKFSIQKYLDYCEHSYQGFTTSKIPKSDIERRRMVTFGSRSAYLINLGLTIEALKANGNDDKKDASDSSVNGGIKTIIDQFSKACGEDTRDTRSTPHLNLTIGSSSGLLIYHEISPERWLLSIVAEKECCSIKSKTISTNDHSKFNKLATEGISPQFVSDDPKAPYNSLSNFDCCTGILNTDTGSSFMEYKDAKDILDNIESKRSEKSLQDLYRSIGNKP